MLLSGFIISVPWSC